jgi:hypothetical protein
MVFDFVNPEVLIYFLIIMAHKELFVPIRLFRLVNTKYSFISIVFNLQYSRLVPSLAQGQRSSFRTAKSTNTPR